jgi:hypothetical protein
VDRSDKPPDTNEGERDELLRFVARDLALPIAATTVAALALVPLPRLVAWVALLLLPGLLGYHVARPCGITAAVTSTVLFLWAHGDPRFASTVTDPWTIRCSFFLGILGALGACAGDWRYRQHLAKCSCG